MRPAGWLGGIRLQGATPGRLICLFALLVIVAMTAGASVAHAASGFGIEGYSLSVSEEDGMADTQAGSHPYELTAEGVLQHNTSGSEGEVRALVFELPPGLIVNPRAVAIEDGVVGEVQVKAEGSLSSAPLEELRPGQGEFGVLGFTLNGIVMPVGIAIRGGGSYTTGVGSYGMTLSLPNLPAKGIEAVKLVLGRGEPGLLTLPTSCAKSPQSTLRGESWGAQAASRSASLPQMTGCGEPAFSPSLLAGADVKEASEPSGYELSLHLPQNELLPGLATAQAENASIALPVGVSLSLSATNGLEGCSEAQFALPAGEPGWCPNGSKIGMAEIWTPLLPNPLEGALYLATPKANPFGTLVAVYLALEDPVAGTAIKLAGEMALNPSTGQATLRFDELPQLPISELELHLFGGERALLANPPVCGPVTASAALAPWNGGPAAIVRSSFEVSEGADGGPCQSPAPFHPGVRIEPSSVPAGGSSAFLLSLSRGIDEQDLSRFSVQFPAGVTWDAGDIQPCGEPAASEGACPSASQIGTAIVSVGPISGLARFTGPAYLTDGYRGGQSGLSIALNATAGPFDLGNLILRATLERNASTGALAITSDSLPQMIDGVPLQMSALEVEIERQGVILYPPVCETGRILTTVESVEEASEQTITPLDVEGCQTAPAAVPSASSAPTSEGHAASGGHHTHSKSASRHAIFHIHGRVSGKHLLLRFRTATGGTLSVAGHGVRRYVRKLRAGLHRVRLELTAFGLHATRNHRSLALRLTLRSAAGSLSAAKWVARP